MSCDIERPVLKKRSSSSFFSFEGEDYNGETLIRVLRVFPHFKTAHGEILHRNPTQDFSK